MVERIERTFMAAARIRGLTLPLVGGRLIDFVPAVSVAFLCIGASLWFLMHQELNLLFAFLIATVLIGIALLDPSKAAVLAIGYLFLLGDLRRVLGVVAEWPRDDLLLLVGPLIAVLLATPFLIHIRLKDRLSWAVLILMIYMLPEVLNPLQGGVSVGAAGALFYLVPMFWFWVGRSYGNLKTTTTLIYQIVLPLACLAAALGLWQTYVGFLPWESAWIDVVRRTYLALNVGSGVRPFGFSVSSAEYGVLVQLGTVLAGVACFTHKRAWILALPVLATSFFLTGQRGLIVKAIVAAGLIWSLRRQHTRGWVLRFGFGLMVLTLGLWALITHLQPSVSEKSTNNQLIQHQVQGLSHPLDSRYSTAGVHSQMVAEGLASGFIHPLGLGLGSTTMATQKFGALGGGSSEVDFSDMFSSLGFLGGFLYLYVIYSVGRGIPSYLRLTPKATSLPVLGILSATLGAWLIAGQYAVSALVWFLIGTIASAGNSHQLSELSVTLKSASLPEGDHLTREV
jgi:hypothetical protein